MADGVIWDDEEPKQPDAASGVVWDDEPQAELPEWATAQEEAPAAEPKRYGRTGSALMGVTSGGSGGFIDEVVGVRDALGTAAVQGASKLFGPDSAVTKAAVFADGIGALGRDSQVLRSAKAAMGGTGPSLSSAVDNYRASRDEVRREQDKAREDNSGYYLAGEIAGGVALPGATTKTGLAQAMRAGARFGAAYGLGSSKADLTKGEVRDATFDTAVGAGLGAAGGAAADLIGKGVRSGVNAYRGSAIDKYLSGKAETLADVLKDTARTRAMKAAGYIQSTLTPLSRQKQAEIADVLLDEGAVPWVGGSGTVAKRTEALKQRAGDQMGKVLDDADRYTGGSLDEVRRRVQGNLAERDVWKTQLREELAPLVENAAANRGVAPQPDSNWLTPLVARIARQKPADREAAMEEIIEELASNQFPRAASEGVGFNMSPVAERVRGLVRGEFDVPGLGQQRNQLSNLADEYTDHARRGVSFSEANRFKSEMQDQVNRFLDSNATDRARIRVQRVIRDAIDDQVEAHLGGETLGSFQGARKLYGAAESANDAATGALNREAGNRLISLSDAGVGGIGALASGSTLGGAAASLAHKLVREMGSSTAARGFNAASAAVRRQWLNALPDIIQSNPDRLGRFAPVFAREMERYGMQGVMALDEALSRENAEYAESKKRALEELSRANSP